MCNKHKWNCHPLNCRTSLKKKNPVILPIMSSPLKCCHRLPFSYISLPKSGGMKLSRVSLAGTTQAIKLSSQVFITSWAAKDTFICTIPSLYLLQVIRNTVHRGHSSQLSSHLHFGQTRDCTKMRNAKDQQEPPLPSPGIEEQQKGHQTKGGPTVSQWLLSLLPPQAP